MSLDPSVLAPVLDAGEAPLASLLTAGNHVFVDGLGRSTELPIWVIATPRRIWVAAADEQHCWAEAWGESFEVEVKKGWTWDAIRVGRWELPLRRGTRSSAETLVAKFKEAGGGGARVASPSPDLEGPYGELARGQAGLPEWWAGSVPAGQDEAVWLLGCESSSTHPFNGRDGKVVQAPLVLGVSDHGWSVAARAPWGEVFARSGTSFSWEARTAGRARVLVDGEELYGPLLTHQPVEDVGALISSEPTARWATAARLALDREDPQRGIRLWEEAWERGRAAGIEPDVARVCFVLDLSAVSVALLACHLTEMAPDAVVDEHLRWRSNQARLRKAAKKQKVKWAHVRGALRPLIDGIDKPTPREGQPWPPASITEVFAHALERAGRYEEAVAFWGKLGNDARSLSGLAASRTSAGSEAAPDDWVAAARAWRELGEEDQAVDCLRIAVRMAERAADTWLLGTWTGEREAFLAAVTADPAMSEAGALSKPQLLEVAELCRVEVLAEGLAAALRRLIALEPEQMAHRIELAEVLEHALGRPGQAGDVLYEAASSELPFEGPRYELWARVAALAAGVGNTARTELALSQAVSGDFLHPEAYRAALDCPGVRMSALRRGWWEHLHQVLVAGNVPRHGPLVSELDEGQLDALHPGGVGWLESVRARIDGAEPPDRSLLVRGLEKLSSTAWPELREALGQVCAALGMDPPPTYVYRGEGAWGLSAWPTEPPALLVGVEHLREGPRKLGPKALVFALAVELAHLRCKHPLLAFDQSLVGTSRSVYTAFGRYAGAAENVVDLVTLIPGVDQVAKLQTLLKISRRVFVARSVVDKATGLASPVAGLFGLAGSDGEAGIGREGLTGPALQFRLHADRVGLMLCGDVRASVEAMLRCSTESLEIADDIEREGLLFVLETDRIKADEGLRITALFQFAATLNPETPHESS